jgi:hypothetical protein
VAIRTSTIVAAILLVAATGCSSAARPAASQPVESPRTSTTPSPKHSPPMSLPTRLPSPTASSSSGPAPFGEAVAVSCAGRPSAEQVVALLRRTADLLPRGATVTVHRGPLCAGTWQYTVISVPQREPLQVVTKGAPSALALVTAGTDVCSIEVRTGAPAGILAVAQCR